MGIYDRDYYREPPPGRYWGNFSTTSITTWLIVLNVLVFIVDSVLPHHLIRLYVYKEPGPYYLWPAGPLKAWGYFSVIKAITEFQLWRFITFQFLHANLGHLVSNMLGLYFFGPIVEAHFGARRYIAFYLLCGSAGAVTYLLLLLFGFLQGPGVPLVGASAGIFGVLVAGAMIAPNATVMLLFPPSPLKFKDLALILVGYAMYIAFTNGENAGGQAAHIGGAVLGFILMRYPFLLNPVVRKSQRVRRRRRSSWSYDSDR
jgi:membrane associated rhomboid family serine protease